MTNVRNIYRNMDVCACTLYPCGHIGRWETHDTFAKTFPEDLPQLVLATKDIDVKWVSVATFLFENIFSLTDITFHFLII